MNSKKAIFIFSIHYFRGISILLIVMGHCYGIVGLESNIHLNFSGDYFSSFIQLLEKILGNLISGGTSLFVFISGLMFHHVFFAKFEYWQFLKKKIINVYLPYLFLSLPAIISLGLVDLLRYDKTIFDTAIALLRHILLGDFFFAYWYISFILLVFIASPIFIYYISLPSQYQSSILLATLCLSLIIHRPELNLNPLHSLVYFLPIYLLGIYTSIYREKIDHLLQGKAWLLLGWIVILAITQSLLYDKIGSLHRSHLWGFAGLDISLLQKIGLCFFWLVYLKKFDDRPLIKPLDYLAKYSFSIFFLHDYLILELSLIIDNLREIQRFIPQGLSIYVAIILGALITLICGLFAHVVKKLSPRHSRILIGC
jgi:hypothetical protein